LRPGSVVEERDRKQLPSDLFIKIAPLRISLLDQRKLPLTPPAFDALLTLVRRSDRLMRFKPHKPSDAILAGEAAKHAFAMLIHPPERITRGARRERAMASARVYVDEPANLFPHRCLQRVDISQPPKPTAQRPLPPLPSVPRP